MFRALTAKTKQLLMAYLTMHAQSLLRIKVNSIIVFITVIGNKRKRGDNDVLETYILLCNQAEEKAAEREERMRMRELEMEERRIEKENIHEERMMSMMLVLHR